MPLVAEWHSVCDLESRVPEPETCDAGSLATESVCSTYQNVAYSSGVWYGCNIGVLANRTARSGNVDGLVADLFVLPTGSFH